MNGGLEGFMSAENDWDEREDITVEVDDHAEDVLEVVTMQDLEDFFPIVYGITLCTSSRTTEVVWVSRVDDKDLACFPGKALTRRRVSVSGPLLTRGAVAASGSSRDFVQEEAPECAMKVDLAFLTLDAMRLSPPLGLAAQDPDLLKFTSAAGKELWPSRDSVLTAAEKFAGDGVATEPAPQRALVSGAAEAAEPGLQQNTDGGTRRSALEVSWGTALGGRIPVRLFFQTKARVAGHRPTRLWSWQVAGALEALTDVKPEECKARLLLLFAGGELLCLDGGSMLLAAELAVEEIPFYGSFRPQEGAGSLALPWSALLNPTWASTHLRHLQETESWMEKRKQFAGGAKPKAGASEDGATTGSGGAKAKARPRRAAKGDVKKEEK
ncbi:unnamed protein product [Polarella glacialis]|uniref:Uncharacterized protein n=1 Tax=Polarella glacialis TaxID=89957 RepID=A0A813JGU7_POLGL|nr:unnamed protein product [Polarella glacialis]